jgi:preprotein translocase SecE subunit
MTTQASTTSHGNDSTSTVNPLASKWINTILFLGSVIIGFMFNMLLVKLGTWFEFEAKIPQYKYIQLVASIIVVFGTLFYVKSRSDLMTFFYETFDEMTKVVFPDKNQSFRLSIFIIIAVTIIGFILTTFDWVARFVIGMIAKI